MRLLICVIIFEGTVIINLLYLYWHTLSGVLMLQFYMVTKV